MQALSLSGLQVQQHLDTIPLCVVSQTWLGKMLGNDILPKQNVQELDEDQDRFPQKFSMIIPSKSVSAFCEEVMKMVDTKQKKGKVWDYSKKEEVEVDGIYINAKAKEGKYGLFGNINLNFIEPKEVDEIPF